MTKNRKNYLISIITGILFEIGINLCCHSGKGRPDLVISHRRNSWIIELKVTFTGESPEKKVEEALVPLNFNCASCESQSLRLLRVHRILSHLAIR